MKIDVNFYGHTVTLTVADVRDALGSDEMDEESIRNAISDMVHASLLDNLPAYSLRGVDALIKAVMEDLDADPPEE